MKQKEVVIICYILVYLFTVGTGSYATDPGLQCLSCEGSLGAPSCTDNVTVTCPEGRLCFTSARLKAGQTYIAKGCRRQSSCPQRGEIVCGKRKCLQCCSEEFCNIRSEDAIERDGVLQEVLPLQCHACRKAKSQEDCESHPPVTCRGDEVCATKVKMLSAGHTVYTKGCEKRRRCRKYEGVKCSTKRMECWECCDNRKLCNEGHISRKMLESMTSFNTIACAEDRTVIVHLFNWKWTDIALECERFLGPKGFCGVQVSPPNEHVVVAKRPWWERYQPVSYVLQSRSGSRREFRNMVRRCNNVNVRIFVDAVINHMVGAGTSGNGTAGNYYNGDSLQFPAVPYSPSDFHCCHCSECPTGSCDIEDYRVSSQVRNCRLVKLVDLDLDRHHVIDKLVDYFNDLVKMGVAGFRVDACKHMWPRNLEILYGKVRRLNRRWFKDAHRPLFYNEVIDQGGEEIKTRDYLHLGKVTEFKYSVEIGRCFRGKNQLQYLRNFGRDWGFLPDRHALVFVDNHDNQRGHGAGGNDILTFQEPRDYKMATAFMLAWPYGLVRVMSSYRFYGDSDRGPPSVDDVIESVPILRDGSCGSDWICEHRWRQITNMVLFRNIVGDSKVTSWWDNGRNQLAFSRENRGFFAVNRDYHPLSGVLDTRLPPGIYCDVISGDLFNHSCTGLMVHVSTNGKARIDIDNRADDPVLALHIAGKQHCSIDILHRILGSGKHHRKWNAWKTDDTTLDWNGPEVQQGSWQGQLALGTPAVWTESEESRPGYHALNRYGSNYWLLDVEMDCSQTDDGWFELKAIVSNHGNNGGWEDDVDQAELCAGNVGGKTPKQTRNHMGRCGFVNLFQFSSPSCIIESF